ncbi:MAG TPA: hypothetical protein VHG88_14300 [Burkholderiales bacterium]|nr:hypothetical protein [Burkholderiales bacterium]
MEADLGARVEALFGRCPELWGFQVQERVVEGSGIEEAGVRELELYIAGIDVFPALGSAQSETLVAQISAALADLLEESPEAADLLAGRTFARTVH